MKIINLALVACVASFVACNSEKTSKTASDENKEGAVAGDAPAYVVEKVSYADSVVVDSCKAVAECSIDYLKSDKSDDALVASVDKWIRHMLDDSDATVAMGELLAKNFVEKTIKSGGDDLRELNEYFKNDNRGQALKMSYEYSYQVIPLELTPDYVTMMFTSYVYLGGAHGGSAAIGQSFDARNGRKLDMDMFKEGTTDKVLQIVKKGIMEQYFEVRTESELRDILLLNNEPFPFPQNPPYFEENGVCFLYQQYEIAPYAAGMPSCVIPFETLRPYFTDDVLQMLGLD